MESAWAWAGRNADQLGLIVGGLAVLVAAWYAWLTRRLWQAALTQAELTGKQIALTRRMFEAEQRPYLAVRFDAPRVTDSHDIRTAIEYRVFVKNGGRSPAIMAALVVEATHDGHSLGRLDGTPALCLFPGQEELVHEPLSLAGDAVHRGSCNNPVVLSARVDYLAGGELKGRYATAAEFRITRSGTFVTHQVVT